MTEYSEREKMIFAVIFATFSTQSYIMKSGKKIPVMKEKYRQLMMDSLIHGAPRIFKNLDELKSYTDEIVVFHKKFSEMSFNDLINDQMKGILNNFKPSENGA